MKFKNILFPVDLSGRSEAATPHVKAMADRFGAKITLLHAVEQQPIYGDFGYMTSYDPTELEREFTTRLASFKVGLFPAGVVERVVQSGDPASVIEEHVKKHKIDLVMLPTRGYGRFRRLLIGSVTAKLLHDLSIPVWTGVHMEELESAEHLACKKMMCAIDIGPESVSLIQAAAEFAGNCDAVLSLVHAIPGTEARPEKYYDIELNSYLKGFAREEIARLQKEAGTNLDVCIEAGGVSAIVRSAALHHAADLVVAGRGEIGNFLGRLRTHSYAIIRDSPCPVLTF